MWQWLNNQNIINARRVAAREEAKKCPICNQRGDRVSPNQSTFTHCEYLWEVGEAGERLNIRRVPGILGSL